MRNTDFQSHRFLDKYSRFFSQTIPTNRPAPFSEILAAGLRFYFLCRSRLHGEWPLYFFVCCALPREVALSDVRSKAERNPMLPFAFDRRLLTFSSKTPAFEPLFQLPPAIGSRIYGHPPKFLAFLRCSYPAAKHFSDFFDVSTKPLVSLDAHIAALEAHADKVFQDK